jgi:hypothetical protein
LSLLRKEKSRLVISTQGEISPCHFDARRNLALSFRREEPDVCHCYARSLMFVIATQGEISPCHFDARRNLALSFRREKKSGFVISTQGEISPCHFDARRNLALSFRREKKSENSSTGIDPKGGIGSRNSTEIMGNSKINPERTTSNQNGLGIVNILLTNINNISQFILRINSS